MKFSKYFWTEWRNSFCFLKVGAEEKHWKINLGTLKIILGNFISVQIFSKKFSKNLCYNSNLINCFSEFHFKFMSQLKILEKKWFYILEILYYHSLWLKSVNQFWFCINIFSPVEGLKVSLIYFISLQSASSFYLKIKFKK